MRSPWMIGELLSMLVMPLTARATTPWRKLLGGTRVTSGSNGKQCSRHGDNPQVSAYVRMARIWRRFNDR